MTKATINSTMRRSVVLEVRGRFLTQEEIRRRYPTGDSEGMVSSCEVHFEEFLFCGLACIPENS